VKPLLLYFLLAFVLPTTEPEPATAPPFAAHTTARGAQESAYRSFQPSGIQKQKRRLRPRLNPVGVGVILLGLALLVGTWWGLAVLWPISSVFWRIILVWLAVSLSGGFVLMGMFGLVFGRETSREVHTRAQKRIEKLAKKLDFKPEKTWCFPDEGYRLSLSLGKDEMMVVDYQQDKGWIIPKESIREIKSDTVSAEQAEARFPVEPATETILVRRPIRVYDPPRRPPNPGPMQVLEIWCDGLPLRKLNLVFYPDVYQDSAEALVAWKER